MTVDACGFHAQLIDRTIKDGMKIVTLDEFVLSLAGVHVVQEVAESSSDDDSSPEEARSISV